MIVSPACASTKKVAIITGASSGIGKSLAYEAAKNGYHLVLTGRNTEALNTIQMALQNLYASDVISISGEISDASFCKELIEFAVSRFQRIDVLVNNAGISMRGLFLDTDLSVIERVMQVNFWGSVYCTKYALPHLLQVKGSIIGISSIAGFKGLPARTGYSASKFALQGFLESLRNENRKTGLHVLIACPGYTESNIRKSALNTKGQNQAETPLDESKLMSSEKVAQQVWRAYECKQWYTVLTVQGKLAVWINKISPKLADWLTYRVISKEPNSPFK